MLFVLLLLHDLLNQIFYNRILWLLNCFQPEIFSLFGFLVDRFQIPVSDGYILIVIEVNRYSLLTSKLNSPPFQLIAMKLFQQLIRPLTQELKIFLLPQALSQFLGTWDKETDIHFRRGQTCLFVAETEISPGIQEISRNNVVNLVVRIMELCWLFLKLLLELFDQRFVNFAFFDSNFCARSGLAGGGGWSGFNVHVDKFIRKGF